MHLGAAAGGLCPSVEADSSVGQVLDEVAVVVDAVVVPRAEQHPVFQVGAAAAAPGVAGVVGFAPGGGDRAAVGAAGGLGDGEGLALRRGEESSGAAEVLDLGRTKRLFTPAQRKALAITQPSCRADGCTVPSTWCEAHHAGQPWACGGRTDLNDGMLLCSWHHHRIHDDRYLVQNTPDGRVRFHRRE